MRRKKFSTPVASAPAATPAATEEHGFREDFRDVVRPASKWHYAFHAVVIAVALSYWIGSLIFVPEASWAEIVMYRPGGDNQVWPVITALSRLNFGDPTDAVNHGQGIGGFHAVILLPHALAFAIFGAPGYMLADAVLTWGFFAALAMLLRRWGLGTVSSLVLSTALTTLSLQTVLNKISEVLAKLLALVGLTMTDDQFPNFLALPIFGRRLPRPFATEILVVLIFYFLVRQWQERRAPTLSRGLALGVLMGLLAQGDPYSFSALGLVSLMVFARTWSVQEWRVPWRFVGGALAGAVGVGWYFVLQLALQHPDSAVRFGLAKYARSEILLLPGYGPWLRVLLIQLLVILVRALVRRLVKRAGPPGSHDQLNASASLALFALVMVVSAWLAQPVQLLLLGQGAQVFHYAFYTLPGFFAYAALLLLIRLFNVLNLARPPGEEPSRAWSRPATGVLCGGALGLMLLLGAEESVDAIKYSGVSRRDRSPWVAFGDAYRPSLRDIDREFRENPALKDTRTFGTFCQEVNYLLTAFHGKRAYLPDNAFTTLSDRELERRLFEFSKLCRIRSDAFAQMIQDSYTLNYWLGCAKYWCASDHKFAPDEDYHPGNLELMRAMPKQSPFNLALPKSEFDRLADAYDAMLVQPSDPSIYPDAVILSGILKEHGIAIDSGLYREVYTNAVFGIYTRVPQP